MSSLRPPFYRGLPLLLLALALAIVGAVAPARAATGPATLVRAFDPTPSAPGFSAWGSYLESGGLVFFTARDSIHWDELWKSDGTPGGTTIVADIRPGPESSWAEPLVDLGGTLLLAADEDVHGYELWASDGTEAGTRLVKDIFPGQADSRPSGPKDFFEGTSEANPQRPVVSGGRAYFVADDGSHGRELWVSDGTTAGTRLVKDLAPGAGGSDIAAMVDVAGTLYFTTAAQQGDVLWKTNGTAAGTVKVADIPFSAPIVSLGGTLVIFGYNAGNYHGQIWMSDGTAAGTKLVKELPDQVAARGWATRPTILNGKIYFEYTTGTSVDALWSTDGTAAGTTPVMQAFVKGLTEVGGKLFFLGFDGVFKLYVSDGTPGRTVALEQLSSYFTQKPEGVRVGNRYMFSFCAFECRLWSSDGTAEGTVPLTAEHAQIDELVGTQLGGFFRDCDFFDGATICSAMRTDGTPGGTVEVKAKRKPAAVVMESTVRIGGRVFFVDGLTRKELWVSDGTPGGTARLLRVPESSALDKLTAVGEQLFFDVVDVAFKDTLWRSDGTVAGTIPLVPAGRFTSIEDLTPRGNTLFFLANYGDLWKSDGTPAGTVPIVYPNYPKLLTNLNGTLIFVGGVSQIDYLWRSDGTAAGSTGYAAPPFGNYGVLGRFVVGGRIIYAACDNQNGPCALFTTDGTAAGTGKVRDFDARECGSKSGCYPDTLTDPLVVGDALYFAARDGGVWGLWRSDGTTEGTALMKAVRPEQLVAVGDRVYFIADDGPHGTELWTSDGTSEGTRQIADIRPGVLTSGPTNLTPGGDGVFFSAGDGSHGAELWTASATGVRLVRDIRPGAAGSEPAGLANVDGQLYFSADDGSHGRELWVSDGEGTRLVQDIAEGPLDSSPGALISVGPRLLFSADDGVHGVALWSLPLSSQPYRAEALGARVTLQAEDYDRGGEGLAYHDAEAANRGTLYRPADGVDVTTAKADGTGGFQVAWAEPGEWLNYTLDTSTTRAYTLTLAVASQGAGATLHLELDGQDVTGPLSVPDTGGWYSWRVITAPAVTVPAGRHTLRLVLDTAGPSGYVGNLDWLRLDAATSRIQLPVVHR